MRDNIVSLLRPFQGPDVRRLTAFALLTVALPRLPGWPEPSTVSQLSFLPAETFGWLALALAVGLFATTGCCRTHLVGRLIAMLAFVLWVILAAATASFTSTALNLGFAYAMLGEIGAEGVERVHV
jgi:multidrug transporter EmrE-like cation transporter